MGFCGEQLVSMGINNTPNGLCIPPVYWWFQFTGGSSLLVVLTTYLGSMS